MFGMIKHLISCSIFNQFAQIHKGYCVSERAYKPCEFCKEEESCKLRNTFKNIRDYTFTILENTTLSELIDDNRPTNETADNYSI